MTPSASLVATDREPFAYRPDVDGLRAIAVLAVVVFHAGIGWVPGGFVGVDVFFVISGYLIGGQIFREARIGAFSYFSFYARRTRRILPALFALLVAFYVVGVFAMTPLELRELGKEAVATIFGASNILFYTGGGYFSPAADLKPLLMTWSLGVEEQFYLLFPFMILGILWVKRIPVAYVLVGLSLFAFVASILLMKFNAKAAFYLLPTRTWELSIGASLAVFEAQGRLLRRSSLFRETFAIVGFTLLAAAIVFYRTEFEFPGYYVLLPTIGTVMLLVARSKLINEGLLARPLMVIIGKISYSWYLWHWPVFYLYRILGGELGFGNSLLLLIISLALGGLSWKFVEAPFRRRLLSERKILACYGVASVIVAALGAGLYLGEGLPGRLSPAARAFALDAETSRESPCLAPYGVTRPRLAELCMPTSSAAATPRMAILGDSHASAISPGFRSLATARGMTFVEMTKSSCPPLWGYAISSADRPGHLSECAAYQAHVFEQVESHPEIRVIILAGFWSSGMTLISSADERQTSLADALERTIRRLQSLGRQVVLVQDVPTYSFDPYGRVMGDLIPLRAALSLAVGSGKGDGLVAPRADILSDPSREILSDIADRTGAKLFDPAINFCNTAGCRYRGPEALYYSDFQHLTKSGATIAVQGFQIPVEPAGR